jgi:signal transduction histidine kinase
VFLKSLFKNTWGGDTMSNFLNKYTLKQQLFSIISIASILLIIALNLTFMYLTSYIYFPYFAWHLIFVSISVIFAAWFLFATIMNRVSSDLGEDPAIINEVITSHISGVEFFDERHYDSTNTAGLFQKLLITVEQVQERERLLYKELEDKVAIIHKQNQDIIFQNRSAAMGEMIGNIAHQWRQPLHIIGLTLIEANFDLDDFGKIAKEQGAIYLKNIQAQIDYLSQTIDDFRNFFNPQKEMIPCPIQETVAYVVSLTHKMLETKGILLTMSCTDTCSNKDEECMKTCANDMIVLGYPNELAQVLLNLISNSRDVLIERKISDPALAISWGYDNDGMVNIVMSDNGGGIGEDIMPKIFDPYFSTKDKNKGTGIGLYMSKTIIQEHHNGTIEVSNNKQGAVFTIKLPTFNKELS